MKYIMITIALLTTTLWSSSALAQRSTDARGNTSPNTTTKMLYHDGMIMSGSQDIYFIWYGCWTDDCGSMGSTATTELLTRFSYSIGGSPYLQINRLYTDGFGRTPSGALFYGGSVLDTSYSSGLELTETGLEDLVRKHIENNSLPQDPLGIYVVVASANIASPATGFCSSATTPPHHGIAQVWGVGQTYAFIGNPNRCPTLEGSQFIGSDGTRLPTPNNDFAGDAMVARFIHAVNNIVSNPRGNAWYDRYGLESADKCRGTFGQTWTTANGARANIRLGGRDYLIGQNWVNDRRGRCALSQ